MATWVAGMGFSQAHRNRSTLDDVPEPVRVLVLKGLMNGTCSTGRSHGTCAYRGSASVPSLSAARSLRQDRGPEHQRGSIRAARRTGHRCCSSVDPASPVWRRASTTLGWQMMLSVARGGFERATCTPNRSCPKEASPSQAWWMVHQARTPFHGAGGRESFFEVHFFNPVTGNASEDVGDKRHEAH